MVIVGIILAINIVYVSFFTVRMILTLKGQKFLAAAVSAIEVTIYIVGLGLVLDNLNEIQNLIAYAVGYAIGVLLGSKIDEWLAIGYVTVNVITKKYDQPFSKMLRDNGYGVTTWMAEGRDGYRLMMEILTRRRDQKDLYHQILSFDPNAFIVSHEPNHFRGGFWLKSLKRNPQHNIEDVKIINEENLPGITDETIEVYKDENPQIEQYLQDESPNGATDNNEDHKADRDSTSTS